jgi:probable aminopeptidase NPEPL1
VVASLVGSGVRLAARIVDAPPAEMDPDALVAEALRVAASARDKNGADVVADVKRFAALEAEGFGGICAVGRCAARDGREPALVHLKLAVPVPPGGEHRMKKKVAVVGKGVTFDTGGLQIKPRTGMPGMKSDLGGAAAALAAFGALCALPESSWSGSTVSEVHLLLCVAENAIGSGAFRPDDVVTHRSGRTSEINNTDAEGRLVLADGVAYASQPARLGGLACDDVIDIATLTGAQMVATGRHFAGVVSDSEAMERACVDAGRASGDLTHALPYAPEFFAGEFASKIADAKNSVKDRSNAQASCAGQFIAEHLWRGGRGAKGKKGNGGAEPEDEEGDRRGERRWLHVDIAGPSVAAGSGRGTGFGVALLVELIAGGGLYRS